MSQQDMADPSQITLDTEIRDMSANIILIQGRAYQNKYKKKL